MKTLKNVLCLFVMLFFAMNSAYSQNVIAKFNKNALYLNAGGNYQLGAGLQYDRVILGGRIAHLSLGTGLGQAYGIANSPLEKGTYVPVNLSAAAGFAGHYVEVGGGLLTQINSSVGAEAFKGGAGFNPVMSGAHVQIGYKRVSRKIVGLYTKIYADGIMISDTPGTINTLPEFYQGLRAAKISPSLGLALGICF